MICPNCVTKMVKNTKKLGRTSVWMLCPSCGLRSNPNEDISSPNIIKHVKPNKRILVDEQNDEYNI